MSGSGVRVGAGIWYWCMSRSSDHVGASREEKYGEWEGHGVEGLIATRA